MRSLFMFGMVVGIALAGIGGAQLRTRARGDLTPVVRTVHELGAPDALAKFHVAVTNFRAGDVHIVPSGSRGGGKNAWAPLLKPDGTWPAHPVFAFLPGFADEQAAARQLHQPELVGILSDSLPGSARSHLSVHYPDVDLANAVSVRVGASLPSLSVSLTLFVVGLVLLVGGVVSAIATTWFLQAEKSQPHSDDKMQA